ncbi:MAG: DinB family protein [Planctomycetota bacterium]
MTGSCVSELLAVSYSLVHRNLADIFDAEMHLVPKGTRGHFAWHLGHCITMEHLQCEAIHPGFMPELPAGLAGAHVTGENTAGTDPSFEKADYVAELGRQREATLKLLNAIGEDQLRADPPSGVMGSPSNIGAALGFIGVHWLVHVGQWVVMRELMGKQ